MECGKPIYKLQVSGKKKNDTALKMKVNQDQKHFTCSHLNLQSSFPCRVRKQNTETKTVGQWVVLPLNILKKQRWHAQCNFLWQQYKTKYLDAVPIKRWIRKLKIFISHFLIPGLPTMKYLLYSIKMDISKTINVFERWKRCWDLSEG